MDVVVRFMAVTEYWSLELLHALSIESHQLVCDCEDEWATKAVPKTGLGTSIIRVTANTELVRGGTGNKWII